MPDYVVENVLHSLCLNNNCSLILNALYWFRGRVSMDVLHIVIMVVAMAVTTGLSFAIPQSDEHKSRVVDHVCICIY